MVELIHIKEVSLKQAKPELERVSVIALVSELNPDSGELSLNESGFSLKVRFSVKALPRDVKKGDFLRVIGKPFNEGKEFFLSAELMQKIEGFDPELLEKVRVLEGKIK